MLAINSLDRKRDGCRNRAGRPSPAVQALDVDAVVEGVGTVLAVFGVAKADAMWVDLTGVFGIAGGGSGGMTKGCE